MVQSSLGLTLDEPVSVRLLFTAASPTSRIPGCSAQAPGRGVEQLVVDSFPGQLAQRRQAMVDRGGYQRPRVECAVFLRCGTIADGIDPCPLPQISLSCRNLVFVLENRQRFQERTDMQIHRQEIWFGQQMSCVAEEWSSAVERHYPQCATMWNDPDIHLENISAAFFPALKAIDFKRYIPPDACVLDVGAGTGWLSALLSRINDVQRIDAVDSSHFNIATMMPQIFEKLQGNLDKVRGIVGLFDPILADAGTYDLVVASSSIHHSNNMFATLREFRRVLKPGGYLLLLNESVRTLDEYLNYQMAIICRTLQETIAHQSQEFSPSVSSGGILYDPTLGDHCYALYHYEQAIRSAGFRYELVDSGHVGNKTSPEVAFTLKHFVCQSVRPIELADTPGEMIEPVSPLTAKRVQQVINVCGEGIDYMDQVEYYESRIKSTIEYYQSQIQSLQRFWESHQDCPSRGMAAHT
jgi:SAM-dependent methyltransferase